MAEIIVKRPWRMQPRNSVEVNKDAAALSGVRASIIQYGSHPNWRVNQGSLIASPTFNGAVVSSNTETGEALKFNGSSTYLDYGTANIPINEFTVIWGGKLNSISNFLGLADCISGANGWTMFYSGTDTLWFSVNGYGGVTNFSGWPTGKFHTGAFRYKSGVERAWFRNGVRLATEVDATSANTSIANFWIGSQRGGGSIFLDGSLNFFYLFDKSLSDEAIVSLQNNPYQLFKPRTLRLFTAAASTSGVGSASGVGTASGIGASINAQPGSASGIGAASGVGASINAQAGTSSGTGAASGVGASLFAGVGSSSGTGSASGVGSSDFAGVGSSSGTSTVDGVGTSSTGSYGTASGGATVNGAGSSTAASVGSGNGVASVSGVSSSEAATVASSSGSATVLGVGDSIVPGSAVGAASGSSSVSGVGASVVAAVGFADGSAVVAGRGASSGGNVEHFAGGYISREERAEQVRKKRVELGIIEEEKEELVPGLEQFEISDLVEKKAVLVPSLKKTEKRIIALEQERIRRNEELKRLIQLEVDREEEQIIRLLMEM